MPENFSYLKDKPEYTLFSAACIEAETVFASSPAMCAVGCRKALELGVKWVYSADTTITMPYKDNLQSLIHESSFRYAMVYDTWKKLPYLIKLGNLAVHTEKSVAASDAVLALRGLFEFIQWIDYCYGVDYTERRFDEAAIPSAKVVVDEARIKAQDSLILQQDHEIAALREQVAALSGRYTAEKDQHQKQREFTAADLSEFATRKTYIDVDLKLLGWTLGDDVWEEVQVADMAGKPGQPGFVDYVLMGKDGLPLAVIEAKRTSKDPNIGRQQAVLYADALERQYGRRPMIFNTNGFETYFWDDASAPQRRVSSIFGKADLQKLMNRRQERKELDTIPISNTITDRYYQKEAIKAVCANIKLGNRKNLLVMATGTGKTRTAASLVDVLSRGGYVTNILFLADRTALVKQARDDFKNYLPHMSLCNLLANREDKNARIVFSTYPTMMNAIDNEKNADGLRLFTPAHFDLIVIDESHRSIFKKYQTIFDYFDAILVGLTATPKTDVDSNTYEFFEMADNIPTYAYDYETAVNVDHVLVPYFNIETATAFLETGITYDALSPADKERYEQDFTEDDGSLPAFIPSPKLNTFVFNEKTVDAVLEDLMTNGIKVAGGDRLGKTIIFAQNKAHAEFILRRFNHLYPQLKGTFAKRITCEDSYAQTIIDDFKIPEKAPHIAVSVDMMDTGIDVPECVNLVLFKKVHSKTKFWQMIGRGTRLCPGLACLDYKDGAYTDKRRFFIFDYLGNFEYFRAHQEGLAGQTGQSISEAVFAKRVRIIKNLQESAYAGEDEQHWREELVATVRGQIQGLNPELMAVYLKRQFVEKFREPAAFVCLGEQDKSHLISEIAPLVFTDDTDEYAKRFDNLIYGLMLAQMEALPGFKGAKNQLCNLMGELQKRITIPQIKAKLPLIQTVTSDDFWSSATLLGFETVRRELRELMKFIVDDGPQKQPVITNLYDPVLERTEGLVLEAGYDYEDYKIKVNRYIESHRDTLAIEKLRTNRRLTETEFTVLENILKKELGTPADYQKAFGDTPLGLLVRKVAKLDHAAAMAAFSVFIDDQSLNQQQIVFVNKVIDYVEQNGYIENITELMKPPFDKPLSFGKLFDATRQQQLVAIVNEVKENAVRVG